MYMTTARAVTSTPALEVLMITEDERRSQNSSAPEQTNRPTARGTERAAATSGWGPGAAAEKITPMLWFDHQAEQAAEHYIFVFSKRPGRGRGESRILAVSRYGEAGPGGRQRRVVRFQLEDQEFTALNGGPQSFASEKAISFVVACDTQDELDYHWGMLSACGEEQAVRVAQGPLRHFVADHAARPGNDAEQP